MTIPILSLVDPNERSIFRCGKLISRRTSIVQPLSVAWIHSIRSPRWMTMDSMWQILMLFWRIWRLTHIWRRQIDVCRRASISCCFSILNCSKYSVKLEWVDFLLCNKFAIHISLSADSAAFEHNTGRTVAKSSENIARTFGSFGILPDRSSMGHGWIHDGCRYFNIGNIFCNLCELMEFHNFLSSVCSNELFDFFLFISNLALSNRSRNVFRNSEMVCTGQSSAYRLQRDRRGLKGCSGQLSEIKRSKIIDFYRRINIESRWTEREREYCKRT